MWKRDEPTQPQISEKRKTNLLSLALEPSDPFEGVPEIDPSARLFSGREAASGAATSENRSTDSRDGNQWQPCVTVAHDAMTVHRNGRRQ